MTRKSAIIIAAAAVLAAALAVLWHVRAGNETLSAPPISGQMQKFTVADGGKPVSDIAYETPKGAGASLADYRGRVVLVNFWATWCGPCVQELPSLARLQKALGGADFTVLALSQDVKGWPVINTFLANHGIEGLPLGLEPTMRASGALRVSALPTTILVGRDGREIGRMTGPAEWDSPEAQALIRHYLDAKK